MIICTNVYESFFFLTQRIWNPPPTRLMTFVGAPFPNICNLNLLNLFYSSSFSFFVYINLYISQCEKVTQSWIEITLWLGDDL